MEIGTIAAPLPMDNRNTVLEILDSHVADGSRVNTVRLLVLAGVFAGFHSFSMPIIQQ
jgi:hypothetical protein